jgi:hypothetical protein
MGALVSVYKNITASDDYFTFKGSGQNYTLEGGTSLTIVRNEKKGNLLSCDLIFWYDDGGETLADHTTLEFGDAAEKTVTLSFVRAIVVPHYDYNVFVTCAYDMQKYNYENLYNGDASAYIEGGEGISSRGEFKSLYILNDINLSGDLTLNYPFYMDLLGSSIYGGGVTFTHNATGVYYIDDSFSSLKSGVENLTCALTRGRLYYKGALQENCNLLDVALSYAKSFIPAFAVADINLPLQYFGTGVEYSYVVEGSSLSAFGDVTRGADSEAVTIAVTATYNGEKAEDSLTCKVVGTSLSSEWEYFCYLLGNQLQTTYGAVEVADDGETTDGSLETDGAEETTGGAQALTAAESRAALDLSYLIDSLTSDGTFSWLADLYFDGDAFSYDGATKLLTPLVCLNESVFSVGVEGESVEKNYTISRSPDADIVNYLDRKMSTVLFNAKNTTIYLPVKGGENLLFGEEEIACAQDITLSYTFFVDEIQTQVKDIKFLTFDEESGALTLDADKYKNEALQVNLNISIGENSYTITKQAVVSYGSFGGDETSFQNASLAYLNSYTLTTFTHSVSGMFVGLQITGFTETDGVTWDGDSSLKWKGATFFEVDNDTSADGYNTYTVAISPQNAPTSDITVQVTIYMYNTATEKAAGTSAATSLREGYFIIPGVLICGEGREFLDEQLYKAITLCSDPQLTNGKLVDGEQISDSGYGVFLVNDSSDEGYTCYLLASGAGDTVEEFSFSGSASGEAVKLDGIEYLTGTCAFTFIDCNISTLEPFSRFTAANNAVTKLTLKNCGLDDEKLWSGGSSYLYKLNRLTECDLSRNSLKTFSGGIVYRTVKKLNLSNNCIADMSGLSALSALTELDISNNKIASFSALCDLSALNIVELYGNTVTLTDGTTDYSRYFGTNGALNVRVYVALDDMGVEVYRDSSKEQGSPLTFGDGGDISASVQERARALNAIAYGTVQRGKIKFTYSVSGNGVTYEVVGVCALCLSGDEVAYFAIEQTDGGFAFADDEPSGEVYLIVKIAGDDEVYAQYKITYTA